MEQKPVLQTFGLVKNYKGYKAVDSVSMSIYEGDIYGFVGENGAGKTTLIRLVSGLIHPNDGEYALFGVSNKDRNIDKAKKGVSAIVESVAVNRGMTAIENLHIQCLIAGVKKSDEELKELLSTVGLDANAIAKKKAGSFSLGMRQRLGLAMIMVSNPKFVLLDEPMNGLDPQGFVDMREAILRLNQQGVTFLISSHILSELDKICTRVGFLSHGHLLEELSIDELHDKARHKTAIRVKNPAELKDLLDKSFKLQETKIEGETLIIYDAVDINDIMKFLTKENIRIEGIYAGEETIEDYYRQLMGGEVRQ